MIQTRRLTLRPMVREDTGIYCEICRQVDTPGVASLLQDPAAAEAVKEILWNELDRENRLNMLILRKDTDTVCGQICMQETDREAPEIGIDIVPEWQDIGYGPEAVRAFAKWYAQTYGTGTFTVCIAKDNTHSRHVFEKLGAVYQGDRCVFSEDYMAALRESLPCAEVERLASARVDVFTLTAD